MKDIIRNGDIILAEDTVSERTNAYLVVHFHEEGIGLVCLTCGDKVGFYGDDKEFFKKHLEKFFNIRYILHKEDLCSQFNSYPLNFPVELHKSLWDDFEIEVEFDAI